MCIMKVLPAVSQNKGRENICVIVLKERVAYFFRSVFIAKLYFNAFLLNSSAELTENGKSRVKAHLRLSVARHVFKSDRTFPILPVVCSLVRKLLGVTRAVSPDTGIVIIKIIVVSRQKYNVKRAFSFDQICCADGI